MGIGIGMVILACLLTFILFGPDDDDDDEF